MGQLSHCWHWPLAFCCRAATEKACFNVSMISSTCESGGNATGWILNVSLDIEASERACALTCAFEGIYLIIIGRNWVKKEACIDSNDLKSWFQIYRDVRIKCGSHSSLLREKRRIWPLVRLASGVRGLLIGFLWNFVLLSRESLFFLSSRYFGDYASANIQLRTT